LGPGPDPGGPREARPRGAPAASRRVPATGRDHGPADPGPPAEATDWAQIAELFGALARLNPSPVVELNRAVAVGLASGPAAGLALLEPLLGDWALERYQPLHAAHAELLTRAGDAAGAARAYERAIALSANAVERAELERRLGDLR
jgi:RNA polymerase sigma-70 factor (ECF subfamily)